MRVLILLAVFVLAGCGCSSLPFASVHPATVRLGLMPGTCSGTYIGPHTILSARHCFDKDQGVVEVNGKRAGYALLADDKHDHVMLRVTTASPVWAEQGDKPRQGDQVFKVGNPLGLEDVLIVGRVAGWLPDGKMLLNMSGWKGDSGAAVFDTGARIVGVVSAIGGQGSFYLMIAYPLSFEAKDWEAARQ